MTQQHGLQQLAARREQGLQPYSRAQIDLIRKTIAPGTTDDELAMFIAAAEHMRLDIFARQIYCTVYNAKDPAKRRLVLVVGIDGYRARAEDSGAFAGTDATWFDCCGTDGNCGGKPKVAKTTVYKIVQGVRVPFVGVARWQEFFVPANADLWNKSGHNQLGKCSEAQAIRRGFQRQVAGLEFQAEPPRVDMVTGELLDLDTPTRPANASRLTDPAASAPPLPKALQWGTLPELCPDHGVPWFKGGNMRAYGHPTEQTGEDGKTRWCQRSSVLARMMSHAREAAEVEPEDAKAWYKETFGATPSALTDEQRWAAYVHWNSESEELEAERNYSHEPPPPQGETYPISDERAQPPAQEA